MATEVLSIILLINFFLLPETGKRLECLDISKMTDFKMTYENGFTGPTNAITVPNQDRNSIETGWRNQSESVCRRELGRE